MRVVTERVHSSEEARENATDGVTFQLSACGMYIYIYGIVIKLLSIEASDLLSRLRYSVGADQFVTTVGKPIAMA